MSYRMRRVKVCDGCGKDIDHAKHNVLSITLKPSTWLDMPNRSPLHAHEQLVEHGMVHTLHSHALCTIPSEVIADATNAAQDAALSWWNDR